MQQIKIEMIQDIVCSWCHIGIHNLNTALQNLSGEVTADIEFLPYQLNPQLGAEGIDITEHLRERNGWTLDEAMDYRQNLLAATESAGVTIDFSRRTRYFNTARAHRLLLAAQDIGLQGELHKALLQAYHVEGSDISNTKVLVELGQSVGLSERFVMAAIESEKVAARLQQRMDRVQTFAVRTVPAFVFNEVQFVSGSNSVQFFQQFIQTEILNHSVRQWADG